MDDSQLIVSRAAGARLHYLHGSLSSRWARLTMRSAAGRDSEGSGPGLHRAHGAHMRTNVRGIPQGALIPKGRPPSRAPAPLLLLLSAESALRSCHLYQAHLLAPVTKAPSRIRCAREVSSRSAPLAASPQGWPEKAAGEGPSRWTLAARS